MKKNGRERGGFFFLHNEIAANIILALVLIIVCSFSLYGIVNADTSSIENESRESDLNVPNKDVFTAPRDEIPIVQDSDETAPQNTYITLTFARSQTNSLCVHKDASATSEVYGYLDEGDLCLFIKTIKSWNKIYYKGGYAYINAEFTDLVNLNYESQMVADVIVAGAKMIGTDYVYGAVRMLDSDGDAISAFSYNAFDCSSFTQYAYYIGAGIKIDVNTRTQIYQGTKRDDLLPGDLMFFTNSTRYYNEGIERVGHVAIYLGENYILHTASDHAVIEQISDLRWSYFIQNNRYFE